MNDESIEIEIQAKGLTAPRVTPADIEANIKSAVYFTAADGVAMVQVCSNQSDDESDFEIMTSPSLSLLTFCVLELRNGFIRKCETTKDFQ